jgi:cytochrome oxidase Cu insertion factor (SCO1/SenC/PrrC family)
MQEEEKRGPRQKFTTILVIALVLIFPALSWYYLQTGLNHRKKALSELKELGKAGDFQLKNQSNLLISSRNMKGKVSIVNFLPGDRAAAKTLADRIAKVQQSFDEVGDVVFLSFIPADTSVQLIDLAKELGIDDAGQWYLLGTNAGEWDRLAKEAYKMPDLQNSVALVDTTGTIRNYYDINANQEMGRLVEQTVLILPMQKRR